MLNTMRPGARAALAALALAFGATGAAAETGIASWYSDLSVTASGRSYRSSDYVAAHKYLPMGTMVRVENLNNGRSAVVRIVDRGPFIAGRIIDVTTGVANDLGFYGQGLTQARVTVIGKEDAGTAVASAAPRKARAQQVAAADEDTAPVRRAAKSKPVRVAQASGAASSSGSEPGYAQRWRDGS